MSAVATYVNISTEMVERDAESAADSIRDSILRVDNMTRVRFIDSREKSVSSDNPSRRQPDVS